MTYSGQPQTRLAAPRLTSLRLPSPGLVSSRSRRLESQEAGEPHETQPALVEALVVCVVGRRGAGNGRVSSEAHIDSALDYQPL